MYPQVEYTVRDVDFEVLRQAWIDSLYRIDIDTVPAGVITIESVQ